MCGAFQGIYMQISMGLRVDLVVPSDTSWRFRWYLIQKFRSVLNVDPLFEDGLSKGNDLETRHCEKGTSWAVVL